MAISWGVLTRDWWSGVLYPGVGNEGAVRHAMDNLYPLKEEGMMYDDDWSRHRPVPIGLEAYDVSVNVVGLLSVLLFFA